MDVLASILIDNPWLLEWYRWGVFIAFVISIAAAFWVFYDSQQKGTDPILWKVVTVVSTILIIPSLILRLAPSLALNMWGAIEPLTILGILAGVSAFFALIAYVVGIGMGEALVCPNCGRPLHPSWDHCPYCAQPEPAPPPPPPPLEPTRPAAPSPPAPLPATPQPVPTDILEKKPQRMAWLVIRSGPRAGKEFGLGEVTNIGREAAQNDIVIDDTATSVQHARIKLEGEQFVLYDLASTNGTFVNDQQIQKHALSDKDVIKIGNTTFVFMEVKEVRK